MRFALVISLVLSWLLVGPLVTVEVKAQSKHLLTGELVDAHSGNPVPFANIFIEGTNRGTSSSASGRFYIQINPSTDHYFRISSIGYVTLRIRIDSLNLSESVVISIKPATVLLDELIITAARDSPVEYVKEMLKALDSNTYSGNYRLEWYSLIEDVDSASGYKYSLETVFDDYHISEDSKYQYKMREQRENGVSALIMKNPNDTLCTWAPWFGLQAAEINGSQVGVFQENNMDHIDFSFRDVSLFGKDTVYVIDYNAPRPSKKIVGWTGIKKGATFKGTLYITKSSRALVRHTYEWGNRNEDPFTYEILYKEVEGYYFPYYIQRVHTIPISQDFQPRHYQTLILRAVDLNIDEVEDGFNWCNNRPPNHVDFWDSNYPTAPQ